MTARDLIESIRREVRDTDVQPARAAELVTKLTALLGNVNDEIREADAEYAGVLLECLTADEAANRAKIRAETTPAYERKRHARDIKEVAIEMIRSLKCLVKSYSEEMRLSR